MSQKELFQRVIPVSMFVLFAAALYLYALFTLIDQQERDHNIEFHSELKTPIN